MFVLIVKEDLDQITKCMHDIKTCLQTVRHHVTVQQRSLADLSGDRSKIKCDKVIFLLSTKSASIRMARTEWIAKLKKIRHSSDYIIITFGTTNQRALENAHRAKEHKPEIVNDNVIKNKKEKTKKPREATKLPKVTDEEDFLQDTVGKALVGVVKFKNERTHAVLEMSDDNAYKHENSHKQVMKDNVLTIIDNEDTETLIREIEEATEEITDEFISDRGKQPKSRGKTKGKGRKGRRKGKKTIKTVIEDDIEQNEAEDKVEEIEDKGEERANEVGVEIEEEGKEIEVPQTGKEEEKKSVSEDKVTTLEEACGKLDKKDTFANEIEIKTEEMVIYQVMEANERIGNNEKDTKDKTKEKECKAENELHIVERDVKAKQIDQAKSSQVASLFQARPTTSSDSPDREEDEDKKFVHNCNHIDISNFEKELFKWWPSILVFLFGKANMGRWVNAEMVPTKHIYCLHHFPDLKESVHPLTRQVLNMLRTFGARKTHSHEEDKQCCLLLCKDAGTHLPIGPKSQLVKSAKDVHVFAIALHGSHFSGDLTTSADRCFSKHNLMNLILVLLTELSLINAQMKHNVKEHQKSAVHIPALFYYFVAHFVFLFNIPALLIHLATSMVYMWPIFIILSPEDTKKKVKYMNNGIIISAIVAILTVILTEIWLYPDYVQISVSISLYLSIWQIGVGMTLQDKCNYKYGIFSIPSELLMKV